MMDSIDPLLWILPAGVVIMAAGVQSAFWAAVSFLSENDLTGGEDGETPVKELSRQRIMKARSNPGLLMRSVWFWVILSTCIGYVALETILDIPRIANILICLAIVYVAGICIPLLSARLSPLKSAAGLSALSRVLTLISRPFTEAMWFLTSIPVRIVGVDPGSLGDEVTEDEILSMVNEGHEQGSIDEDEAEMITNIFELDDKQAQDIMTHRGDINAIDGSTALDDAILYMAHAPNSRFPVFEDDIDNIIGALYLKDAMSFHMKEKYNRCSIRDIGNLLREVTFIPEAIEVDELFRLMQKSRRQMAIVVNEYGETSGLVTMEDILEEIVGNILDEYDKEEKLITRLSEGHYRIRGKALLDDVEKVLGVQIRDKEYDTLSGYLTEKLRHIPMPEDRGKVIEDKALCWRFRILNISGSMIGQVDATAAPDLSGTQAEE